MPLHLQHILDKIPLPSLRYYTLISISLLFGNIFYFHYLIQSNKLINNQTNFYLDSKTFSFTYIQTLLSIIISQSLSLLLFINTIYCSIALFGKKLQLFIFGELSFVELQRIKDKFFNYIFYKFCFLFGVLGLENLNELILWISWFFILLFVLLFSQLAKDRFQLLSISILIRRQSFIKVFCLLISLLYLCFGLFIICFLIGLKYGGLSIFFFMLAETILLTFDIIYLLFKYIFIQQQENNISNEYNYYIEFLFDIFKLIINIIYNLQMLFYHQTFMSMSSLIFFMQLKSLFNELTQRLKRHKSYCIAMIHMEKKYPLLTKYELEEKFRKKNHLSTLEEICSICWENFEKARCLPCGHLFHENCLRSWLEQDSTCPICRLSLHEDIIQPTSNFLLWPSLNLATNARNLTVNNNQHQEHNHLFRFHGNQYLSWLPNFSIEINHNFPFRLGLTRLTRLTDVQLTNIAQNIQQIFPQIPFEFILSDLQQTQSMNMTIENIIEQRIHFQSQQQEILESSEINQSIHTDLLLNSSQIIQNNNENFTWPLDRNLSFANRKQQLISYMKRRYLEHESRLQLSSYKSDLLIKQ